MGCDDNSGESLRKHRKLQIKTDERTAAPPPANDELRVMAKQWREEHLGHFLNSRELGEDGEDKLFDAKLYVLLAQVAARERWDEHKLVCGECHCLVNYPCLRGAELQKAVAGGE